MTTLPRRSPRTWLPSVLLLVPIALILAGTAYQALFALEVVTLGDLPGEDPPGYQLGLAAGLVGMLMGAILGPIVALSSDERRVSLALPPAALAFVVARHFTFDSYYGSDMVRFSEQGPISPEWLVFLAVWAAIATWTTKHVPSLGPPLTSVLLLTCAATAVFQQTGH